MTDHRDRQALRSAIQRCHNPNSPSFKDYGGRGIAVCEEWRREGGFDLFMAEIGPRPTPRHTVDRIDNYRGYEPGNVRWATPQQQADNRRRVGRKPKAPEDLTQRKMVSFRLPPRVRDKLVAMSHEHGISQSAVVEMLLDKLADP